MQIRKNLLLALLLQTVAFAPVDARQAFAGNVDVDVNIRLGGEPRQVIVTEPAYRPDPYYEEAEEEVEFICPEPLGFYVAVGVPYDLFYIDNSYFVYRDGRWFRSPNNRGGWVSVRYRELPPPLRRHRIERIREYRNREYVVYQRERDHYRGRHRSDRGYWRMARKEKEREERRFEKEQRRDEKRFEKEQRHEEKRFEKEQRREEREHRRERRERD